MALHPSIILKVFVNGLTVMVLENNKIPSVSMEMWYRVGSINEGSKEKGLAHLIEHMWFKGTDKLSESDINDITHSLSGYTNAFTMQDATGYIFTFPSQNWKVGIEILADCMTNCHFNEQMLNSELKAVIQELKRGEDNYEGTLYHEMLSLMYQDHPYGHPIIGYKHDLWNLDRDNLFNFYKKHYAPNNAFLVVVGDVKAEEVFDVVEKQCGTIPANTNFVPEEFYHSRKMVSKSITLFRDVQVPVVIMAADLPSVRIKKNHHMYDVLASVLASGKNARLEKLLVDELKLVSSIGAFAWTLNDATPFFIAFEPKDVHDIQKIKDIIFNELAKLAIEGPTEEELACALKKSKVEFLQFFEYNRKMAHTIAQLYMQTGDPQFIYTYLDYPAEKIKLEIKELCRDYCIPSLMYTGEIMPLHDVDKPAWQKLQSLSDSEDARILNGRVRTLPVEPARYAKKIQAKSPSAFSFAKAEKIELSNGMKVLMTNSVYVPKIDIVITFKARGSFYDPEEKQGLYEYMTRMLFEGTKNYKGTTLAQEMEKNGIHYSVQPGSLVLSMLSEDFEIGLGFAKELLMNATFPKDALKKICHTMEQDLKSYWDEPTEFATQLIVKEFYKDHPYSKCKYGTFDSLKKITQKDLIEFYKSVIVPKDAIMAIVGDVSAYDVKAMLEKYLSDWKGSCSIDLTFPQLEKIEAAIVSYPINRDQVVLAFVKPSITRLHPDFDALLLFEQAFSGGDSSSMSSKLFALREHSGLFYSIGGTFFAFSDEQPGLFIVKTMVSLDRLKEAETEIKKLLATVADSLTQEELDDAKKLILNNRVKNFESNARIATTFLFLNRYSLPADYFDTRAASLEKITLDDVKKAVKRVLKVDELVTFKIGRVGEDK